ncbi:MAG: hypothetical protein ISS15_00445 [Alphaproteobacteria bacterium]|nr:hypothetical protein [Alphaproteobacteria bacterium]MBL6937339.1 hypothetical protein [Alphaproteobacteria bacterium]MBL7096099.1 hypothetical protein [Alphaproteobacteria bacterium]
MGRLRLALLASLFPLSLASSANAQHDWRYDRDRAEGYARETGGYCDRYGCPDRFWRYPVHYGPVFVDGHWFKGPVYFRGYGWNRQYWVHGSWHRDEWRGPRPWWARQAHDGPPLSFAFYMAHGFRIEGHWHDEHDADQGGGYDHGGDWHDHGGSEGDWHDHHDTGGDHGDRGGSWQGGDHGGYGSDQGAGQGRWNNGDQTGGPDHPPAQNVITVTSATYGASCHQPNGNVTHFLADACNGKATCDYTVRYQTIGDPAPGCAKDFSVQWTCSAGQGGSQGAPAEAGFGSKVTLQCAARP